MMRAVMCIHAVSAGGMHLAMRMPKWRLSLRAFAADPRHCWPTIRQQCASARQGISRRLGRCDAGLAIRPADNYAGRRVISVFLAVGRVPSTPTRLLTVH